MSEWKFSDQHLNFTFKEMCATERRSGTAVAVAAGEMRDHPAVVFNYRQLFSLIRSFYATRNE